MILIEKTEIVGLKPAIRGMRNPMNSWEKSDSGLCDIIGDNYGDILPSDFRVGEADFNLMLRLAKAGSVDAKFRRMIAVYVDITAPLYWWKEFDTYKVGTVANSCSTMHKIHAKEFALEDFSHEHLIDYEKMSCNEAIVPVLQFAPHIYCGGLQMLDLTIYALNFYRQKFLKVDSEIKKCHFNELEKREELVKRKKEYWWQMIQLLPSSYNQKRTVMLNYEVLSGVYPNRHDHKLDEWREFCKWIEGLPYSEIITGKEEENK